MYLRTLSVAALGVCCIASGVSAKEYPIGEAQEKEGMKIAAVYLQPIEMDPPGMMREAKNSDVHLEADIKAAKGNPNGFAEGEPRLCGWRDHSLLAHGGACAPANEPGAAAHLAHRRLPKLARNALAGFDGLGH